MRIYKNLCNKHSKNNKGFMELEYLNPVPNLCIRYLNPLSSIVSLKLLIHQNENKSKKGKRSSEIEVLD